ncbi:MAG: tetraacyldisaccharide 4'-kinase [Pseudomonadota bacterium]
MAQMDEVLLHVIPDDKSSLNDSEFALQAQPLRPIFAPSQEKPMAGEPVNMVAAIGKPERFFKSLEALGFIGQQFLYPDHHTYSEQDLTFENNLPILMTEKDAIKCRDFSDLNIWTLPVTTTLPSRIIDRIINELGL